MVIHSRTDGKAKPTIWNMATRCDFLSLTQLFCFFDLLIRSFWQRSHVSWPRNCSAVGNSVPCDWPAAAVQGGGNAHISCDLHPTTCGVEKNRTPDWKKNNRKKIWGIMWEGQSWQGDGVRQGVRRGVHSAQYADDYSIYCIVTLSYI